MKDLPWTLACGTMGRYIDKTKWQGTSQFYQHMDGHFRGTDGLYSVRGLAVGNVWTVWTG